MKLKEYLEKAIKRQENYLKSRIRERFADRAGFGAEDAFWETYANARAADRLIRRLENASVCNALDDPVIAKGYREWLEKGKKKAGKRGVAAKAW